MLARIINIYKTGNPDQISIILWNIRSVIPPKKPWTAPAAIPIMELKIVNDKPNDISKPFSLDRFENGLLIDEHGAAGVAH